MRLRKAHWNLLRSLLVSLGGILWLEGVYRAFYVRPFFDRGLVYILLFSLPLAALGTLLSCVGSRGVNRWTARILGIAVTLWYMIQAVYHTIFTTVLVTQSFNMAGQALGSYWRETLEGIWTAMPALLLLAVPLLAYALLSRWIEMTPTRGHWQTAAGLLAGVAVLQTAAVLAIYLPTGGIMTMRQIYRESFIPDMAVAKFGVATTLRLDITQSLFGLAEPSETPAPPASSDVPADGAGSGSSSGSVSDPAVPPPVVYPPNVMQLDFDALIAGETDKTLKAMHEHVQATAPTLQNQYTGIFAGKNLIFLTGEAFWSGAVSEKYTPTLYKLSHEGFVCSNFYNPLWYYSTVDGEYAACTGLIPSSEVNASFRYTGKHKNSMYFCMGNQLRKLGYPTMAYHNNGYKYYDRNLSHPNMGYDFYGVGNGLEVKQSWPESDLEMMEKTLPQALAGAKPFHNYYMTVSGHMNYTFVGNSMSAKHRDAVADLEMSEAARAYLACNIELDKALEYTLKTLEEAGELENTVIVMSGDHYPYGLDGTGAIDELAGAGTEADPFARHHSTLILWSGDQKEPIAVDKVCQSVDILPTLSNLFGLEYDSRLLAGRDILSDAPGLVIFNNKSFITDLGQYNAKTDQFTPREGAEVPEGYAAEMFKEVKSRMSYSSKVLFNDYYRTLGLVPESGS